MSILIDLNKCDSIDKLREHLLSRSSENDTIFIAVDGEVLVVVPASAAKEQIASKIATHIAEHPSVLTDLQNRLENEVPEDWE